MLRAWTTPVVQSNDLERAERVKKDDKFEIFATLAQGLVYKFRPWQIECFR